MATCAPAGGRHRRREAAATARRDVAAVDAVGAVEQPGVGEPRGRRRRVGGRLETAAMQRADGRRLRSQLEELGVERLSGQRRHLLPDVCDGRSLGVVARRCERALRRRRQPVVADHITLTTQRRRRTDRQRLTPPTTSVLIPRPRSLNSSALEFI